MVPGRRSAEYYQKANSLILGEGLKVKGERFEPVTYICLYPFTFRLLPYIALSEAEGLFFEYGVLRKECGEGGVVD